jgi:hypothetical protein
MDKIQNSRLARESTTIQAMIGLYCHDNHHTSDQLCPECLGITVYARERLEKCPFGAEKPTCAKCKIHCYRPEMRAKIRRIMGYAGPRMLLHHPVLSILHLIDGRRPTPDVRRRKPRSLQD